MTDVCQVCTNTPGSSDKVEGMIICDGCLEYFECMSEANESQGEAWSEFENAHPDKKCSECIDCGEWVALTSLTENASCPQCGGSLNNDEAQEQN